MILKGGAWKSMSNGYYESKAGIHSNNKKGLRRFVLAADDNGIGTVLVVTVWPASLSNNCLGFKHSVLFFFFRGALRDTNTHTLKYRHICTTGTDENKYIPWAYIKHTEQKKKHHLETHFCS